MTLRIGVIPALLGPLCFSGNAAAFQASAVPAGTGVSATTIALLCIVLGTIVAALLAAGWLARRVAGRTSGMETISVAGQIMVGPRQRIVVVEVGNQWVVAGISPGQISALAQLPKPAGTQDAVATLQHPLSFSTQLRQIIQRCGIQMPAPEKTSLSQD